MVAGARAIHCVPSCSQVSREALELLRDARPEALLDLHTRNREWLTAQGF